MKRFSLVHPFACLVGLAFATAVGGGAWAASGSTPTPTSANGPYWSLGGAAQAPLDGNRVLVWDGGSLSAGFAQGGAPSLGTVAGKGMQMGGFLAWRGEGYRFDATLAPALDGSFSAGVGASLGAVPGEVGTSYGVRLGAALAGERFTVNPASGLGLAQMVAPNNDVNLTVTVNHALTPSLSVIGTAEARRVVGSAPDGSAGQNHFSLGAGLGYRF